jgi:hypothetical protein
MKRSVTFSVAFLLPLCLLCGCRSYLVDLSVENHTGSAIQLLEVDYPSASFGTDSLAAGATYHYRIQVTQSGPLKVQYTEGPTHTVRQITGTELHEGQEGRVDVVLLPDGKAEFHPQLDEKH